MDESANQVKCELAAMTGRYAAPAVEMGILEYLGGLWGGMNSRAIIQKDEQKLVYLEMIQREENSFEVIRQAFDGLKEEPPESIEQADEIAESLWAQLGREAVDVRTAIVAAWALLDRAARYYLQVKAGM